ncbi:MAG: acyl carrier protein [Candidatus Omnitrophica bacterium]|nr:acyl carrier protein [Candidatus Omnitrophota bacterium]
MENSVFEKIQETLSGALGVDKEDIQPASSLTRDLGAESIDFIDIIFRLEKAFEIKIPSGDLFPGNILNDERLVQNGIVTPAGLEEIKLKMPYLDVKTFSQDPKISRLAEFFTVQMVIHYIEDRLARDAQKI